MDEDMIDDRDILGPSNEPPYDPLREEDERQMRDERQREEEKHEANSD